MRIFRRSRSARLFQSALTAMLCAGLAGCTQYRLGSMLPPGLTSIHVPTFANGTSEPQLEFETTNATIQEFQETYDRNVATHPNEYRQQLVADVVLKDSRTQKVLLNRKGVVGEWTFLAGSDLRTDERVADG